MRRLLVLFALLVIGCPPAEPPPSPAPVDDLRFRVVFMADPHLIGPQYTCCSESPGLDNDSIMRTPERLAAAVAQINTIEPAPDMVFVLGDIVHAAHFDETGAWYASNETAWSRAAEILGRLEMPFHLLWGNHDYEVNCTGETFERSFSHELFADFFGTEPYYAIDHKGWRFLATNTQLGPTWEAGHPMCDTGLASFGDEQLAWIDAQLAEGLPTMALGHYMLPVTKQDESPGSAHPDMETVLNRYAGNNLAAYLVGHTHRWLELSGHPFPHIVLGATRYDADNFWLAEFDGTDGSVEFLDWDKAEWFTTCAETWLYDDGQPVLDPLAQEDGDCGFL